ncbi:MAG: hypothetical protein ACTHNU_08155 [Gaiellales bacterium]
MSEPILDRLLGPEHPELGCDDCFDNLDRYVEIELAGAAEPFERCNVCVSPADCARSRHCLGMRAHLQGCPACEEEYRSLKALVTAETPPDGDASA